jgi:hypothetical protein
MQVQVPTTRRVNEIKQMVMPIKGDGVFIAPNANVLGDVKIGSGSSIWYGATLRGGSDAMQRGQGAGTCTKGRLGGRETCMDARARTWRRRPCNLHPLAARR